MMNPYQVLGVSPGASDDEIKKATNRTVKRLIIGVLIFFLPFLLDFIFDVFGFTDISRCGIGT